MTKFSDRLKALHGDKNTTEFARSIRIPQATIYRYLEGRIPTGEYICKICDACNCSADWLLGRSESRFGINNDKNLSKRYETSERKLEIATGALSKMREAVTILEGALKNDN